MTQGSNRTRSLARDDDPPQETRSRRVQQAAPQLGYNMPGMAPDMAGPDGDGPIRFDAGGGGWSGGPWWRPVSGWGRFFMGLLTLTVLCGLGISVFLLKSFLDRDGRFRIAGTGNIQAIGLTEVSRAEILPIFGEDIGRNVFFVPLNERRKQLEQIPWIERATVMRMLPDQIRVEIVERRPVAFVRQGSQVGLVDANGVPLTMPAALMTQHHYSFPVVTGIDVAPQGATEPERAAARKARMAVYARVQAELDSTGQHLSEQISEMDLEDTEDVRILMPEPGVDILIHLGEDHYLDHFLRYKAHIAEWRQQYPKLAAADLRYEQQTILEMTPETNAVRDQAQAMPAPVPAAPTATVSAAKPGKKPAGKPAATDKAIAPAAPAHKQPSKGPLVKAKAKAKPGAKAPARRKTASQTRQDKKRAEARRAAQKQNRRNAAPNQHPAVELGQ